MRHRKVIIAILPLVACGILAAIFWPEKPEPVYKGKKLSEWVVEVATKGSSKEANDAVQSIGTNGISFYLKWIGYRPSWLERSKTEIAYKMPWLRLDCSPDERMSRSMGAAFAMLWLKERAEPAIPQLLSYAKNINEGSMDDRSGEYALTLLAGMGAAGVPAMLSLMTNENPVVRACAIYDAKDSGDSAIVAQIQKALQDPHPRVRKMATDILGIPSKTGQVLP
jgi:hypothetical protein